MKKNTIFLFQIILIFLQGIIYFFSEKGDLSFFVINFSALSVVLSFCLSWFCRRSTIANGYGFSIILIFTFFSWIISFQIPLELVYGNLALLDPNLRMVYDITVINKLVAFNSLMLNFFLTGVTYSYSRNCVELADNKNVDLPSFPLFILISICFFLFMLTFNSDYSHGEVKLDENSATIYGFIVKFSAIYLAIVIYNLNKKNRQFYSFIKKLNIYYFFIVFVLCSMFFYSNNRVYSIMLLMPLFFSYFIFMKKKISALLVLFGLVFVSVLGVLFKIYGLTSFYKQGFYIDETYVFSNFIFPYTSELAGSFYSSNIIYSMWESGYSLYGMTFVVGVIRTIPGVMGFLGLPPVIYDSAVVATLYSGTNYGVGTTAIIDLLVNFGVVFSLLIFSFLGYFFGKSEIKVYATSGSIYSYIVFLTITILILFYPRASLNDLISMVFFNLIFCKFYFSILRSKF